MRADASHVPADRCGYDDAGMNGAAPESPDPRRGPVRAAPLIRPLRVLVVQNVVHDLRGGMTRMLGFIHDRAAADGHHIEYFSAGQVPPAWSGRRARLAFPWLALQHAHRAAESGRPYDVINVHEPVAWALLRSRAAIGAPVIAVTTHGVEERGWASILEDDRRGRECLHWRTRLAYPASVVWPSRYALRHADHIFCLNEDDRRYLLQRYPHQGGHVTRLFPAADEAYLAASGARDYAAPPERLLWFGTWLVRKGTPDVIAAFSTLAERFPKVKLVVMGAGVSEEVVLRAFPERLRGRVEYVPPPADASGAAYAGQMLRTAAYLLPSVFEGTPLTLMETMATGLMPIGAAVCGIKDVIRDEENGLLVPPRDAAALAVAIEHVLRDSALRERLGRQAHADVEAHYTWDRVSEPLRAVYRDIAAERGGLFR